MLLNLRRLIAGAALAALLGWGVPAVLAGTSLTYQGQLKSGGIPADGTYAMIFRVFDAPAGGNQPGSAITIPNVNVVDGLFSVELDYGAAAFNGLDRWLETVVNGTTLSPRVELTNAPYATFSQNTRGLAVDGAGNVGIDNAAPSQQLVVGNFLNFADTYAQVETAGSNSYRAGLKLRHFDSGYGWTIESDERQVQYGLNFLRHFADPAGISTMFLDVFGNVGIGTTSPGARLHVNGTVRIDGANTIEFGGGVPNKEANAGKIGYQTFSSALDIVGAGTTGTNRKIMLHAEGGTFTTGPIGIGTTTPATALDVNGIIRGAASILAHQDGSTRIQASVIAENGAGIIDTYNAAGARINYIGTEGASSNPMIGIVNTAQTGIIAALFRDVNGVGGVVAQVKNFRVPNPADSATDIWYASLEGPEAGMYVRGKGRLENGQATIELPEHFQSMMVPESLTVQLTAASLKSRGLAYEMRDGQIVVGELNEGQASYEFSWVVTSVRRGFENYQVLRPWDDLMPADVDRDEAWQARLQAYQR